MVWRLTILRLVGLDRRTARTGLGSLLVSVDTREAGDWSRISIPREAIKLSASMFLLSFKAGGGIESSGCVWSCTCP